MIKELIIHNYKLFDHFELVLNNDLNIIVGDNETGKSTILEAVNLALTKKLNGRFVENELTSFLFNNKTVQNFIIEIKAGKKPKPPSIYV